MNRKEHLLTITAEECVETAQRISKALRFGMQEGEPGQDMTNAERIMEEYADIAAMFDMLVDEGVIVFDSEGFYKRVQYKKKNVEKYLLYSKQCGTLTD